MEGGSRPSCEYYGGANNLPDQQATESSDENYANASSSVVTKYSSWGWDYNGEPIEHKEGWTMVEAGIEGYGGEKLQPRPDSPTVLDSHIFNLKPDVYVSLIDPWFIGHAVLSTNKRWHSIHRIHTD